MKKMTRLLCLLLCAVMVCSILPPAVVSAEGPGYEDGWKYEEKEKLEEVPVKQPPASQIPEVEEREEAPILDAATKSEYGDWNIENFADLKEVLAAEASNTDWISIHYHGTEPLVITEDFTIPGDRQLNVSGLLQVAEGVTLTVEHTGYSNGAIYAKQLKIDGTLINNGSLQVGEKLTVNGSLKTDGVIVDYKGQIEGADNIEFFDEWGHISLHASTESMEELVAAIKDLTTKVGGKIQGYVSLWTGPEETGMVLNESLTVPDGVSLNVNGDYGPFVIGEGATLTFGDSSLSADKLVVKGTLILPEDSSLYCDELQVDGTADIDGYINVWKKITVNGTLKLKYLSLDEEITVVGLDKIQVKNDGAINYRYTVKTAEEFYKKLADVSALVSDKIKATINMTGGGTILLDKSFTIPEYVNVHTNTFDGPDDQGGIITIPEGCTVTVDGHLWIGSKVTLKGNLVTNKMGSTQIEGDSACLEISGGKVSGVGEFYIYAEDPATKISGLDMSKYELIEEWEGRWLIYNVEGMTKLPTPAAPKWGIRYEFKWNPAEEKSTVKELAAPTSIAITKGVDNAEYMRICVYYEGEDGPEQVYWNTFSIASAGKASLDIFQDENRPSGTYYVTLQAIGDYVSTRSSDIVTSEKFVYTNPGKALAKVTNVKAENDLITWDAHPQADLVDYFTISVWYARTAQAEPENMWWNMDSGTNSVKLPEYIKQYIGEGYYYFSVTAHPKDASKLIVSEAVMSNAMKVELPETQRYAGKDRFDTSFKVADALLNYYGDDKFNYVIVASGANFADALAGSYLASWYGAPILLSYKDKQNNQVKEYIKENLVENGVVFILGGESAVPKSMEKGLEAYKVVRLAGSNRFGTNLEILKQAGIYRNAPILVATGSNFADSLSASAVGAPILLVHKKLTNEQKDFLTKKADVNKNSIYILGGESAVNAAIEAEFKAMGFHVKRLAGKNRFDTSILIAEEFFGEPTSAILAYAANYPDGLCGGALANVMGAPLILTMDKQASVAAEYVKQAGIERAVSLGGEGLISDAAVNTILGK